MGSTTPALGFRCVRRAALLRLLAGLVDVGLPGTITASRLVRQVGRHDAWLLWANRALLDRNE